MHQISAYNKVLSFIAAIDVEDLDFDKEYKEFVEDDPVYIQLVNPIVGKSIAKHFFRLGAAKGYPITAEKDFVPTLEDVEIILNAFLDFWIENNEQGKKHTGKEYCQEVLKRYLKERKEK